jgi:protein SCO1
MNRSERGCQVQPREGTPLAIPTSKAKPQTKPASGVRPWLFGDWRFGTSNRQRQTAKLTPSPTVLECENSRLAPPVRPWARWTFGAKGLLGGALVLVLFFLVSCARHPEGSSSAPATKTDISTNRQVYQVKGIVREVLADQKKVRIAHEEIPGYMAAMTMPFDVKDAKELEGLATGDEVTFRMIVTKDDGWIDQLKKVGQAAQAETPGRAGVRIVRDVDPLAVGDPMPDYQFTNETGRAVSLRDFQGQAFAFTFIFTRCPFPTFCPRMSNNFADVYKQLKSSPNAPTNWHLLTITMDPDYDTPQVLQNYAKVFVYDPQKWNYLTGALIDITAIGEQFGLEFYRPDPSQPAGLTHNLRTVVIDAAGRVHQVFIGNEWKIEDMVSSLIAAAQVPQTKGTDHQASER